MKRIILVTLLVMTAACAVTSNPNLNSVLWVQTAAEYQASSYQAYNAARNSLDTAIDDDQWTAALEQTNDYYELPPAVIFDIDETVLDNCAYQAQLVLDKGKFTTASWDRWIEARRADAAAGAVKFINDIQDRGIEVLFITNRACRKRPGVSFPCPQETDTLANLNSLGITRISKRNILLKDEYPDWGSEKKSRREYIIEKYRVLMIFGDDLGDFIPDVKEDITPEKRRELATVYEKNWGRKWFILPNPMYGSWYQVLKFPIQRNLKGVSGNRR